MATAKYSIGSFTFVRGFDILKLAKKSTDLHSVVSYFSLWESWSFVWGVKPKKLSRGDGTG